MREIASMQQHDYRDDSERGPISVQYVSCNDIQDQKKFSEHNLNSFRGNGWGNINLRYGAIL